MRTVDTSVAVAAFASWHEKHEAAREALHGDLRLIDHCAIETYSVLTRLPAPHRAPALLVREFLRDGFPRPYLRLSAAAHRAFVLHLPEHEIAGGSVYDALVAATAVHAGAELLSCDRRATPIYERYGVRVRLL
ncbi:MAG: type II toxin-antitoxin system VapC family toxin [Polyangiales bacterium]